MPSSLSNHFHFVPAQAARLALTCALIITGAVVRAQNHPSFEELKAKYPKEHAVMLEDTKTLTVKIVKGHPKLEETITEVYMILDEAGVSEYTKATIDFTTSETISEVKAYSVTRADRRINAQNFETTDVLAGGFVFYDGSKQTSFSYPQLGVGSVRYLTYKRTVDEERFPTRHFFSASVPVIKSSFRIVAHPDVEISYKLMNIAEDQLTFETSMGKERTFLWETNTAYQYKREPNAPAPLTYVPHIIAQVASYNYSGQTFNLLTSVADLHRWYEANIYEVENEVPNGELSQITDSLTRALTTDLDKVKAVYYWVQENIKYIAFEEGINGFVPRQPSNVLHKRYGDCKDMASIIYAMLKSVNIESNLTWVGTRHLPYRYEDFPTTAVDNHMIATYNQDGKVYVLDATSSFQPIDLPTSFIQGKELLIHQGTDRFVVYPLPIASPEISQVNDSTRFTLSGTAISGTTTTTLSGYWHIDAFHALNGISADEQQKRMAKLYQKGNNSFTIRNQRLEHLADRSENVTVAYDFSVQNYVTATQNELFLNLVLDKEIIETVDTKRRTLPIVFDNCSLQTYATVFDIPEGYAAGTLPKNTDFHSDFVDYTVSYSLDGSHITVKTTLAIKQLSVPPASFEAWNTFQTERAKSLAQRIVLTKKQ